MANMTRHQRMEEKREQAAERQARWDTLTNEQKLADLDRRGERAEKQRKRIKKAIAEASAPKKGEKTADKAEEKPKAKGKKVK